jgi:hypothetical protein
MDSNIEFSDGVHQSLEIVELIIGWDNGDDPHHSHGTANQQNLPKHFLGIV